MSKFVKCDSCCKENVCKYISSYTQDCNQIETMALNSTTVIDIKCSEFMPKKTVLIREPKLNSIEG